ncbi:MAG: lytic murein transglycosylase B [Gammaproteobacteria bacterium]|nr:lytic murein transglycosylase B [Gammaproteobacteria bacterium]
MHRSLFLVALVIVLACPSVIARSLDRAEIDAFSLQMQKTHGFDAAALRELLSLATRLDSVLAAISKPAETKPWHEYRAIFVTPERVRGGAKFWVENATDIDAAFNRFGVPAEIIVAIIGVETAYGRNAGNYRVLDALGTLAFHYPKRASFFRTELEQFLLLTREEKVDPVALKGSYAGAMGIPQFMPSSFRTYAVDFNADGHRDIWAKPADAIGSVANYLQGHGWKPQQPIVLLAAPGEALASQASETVELTKTLADFAHEGVHPTQHATAELSAVLLAYEGKSSTEYWFGLNNFYVITRYNRSPKYALAVVQLADAIKDLRASENAPQAQ